jgi:hypothetical protein
VAVGIAPAEAIATQAGAPILLSRHNIGKSAAMVAIVAMVCTRNLTGPNLTLGAGHRINVMAERMAY